MTTQETDFIVVGAGSSGCALAARLAEYSDSQIVLLEAGGSGAHPLVRMPLTWMQAMTMPRFGWGTMSESEPHLDGRVQPLPRGRVLVEQGRACGVEFERAGERHVLRARREVILCGGSFNSPQLLMLSGIGPAAQLQQHGIGPIADSYEARVWFPLWRKGAGHQIAAGTLLLSPRSRGHVRLASADPKALLMRRPS